MSRPKRKSNRELKDKYEREIMENENEIDVERAVGGDEKNVQRASRESGCCQKVLMTELEETKDSVCETGNYTGQQLSTQIGQLPLNACRQVNLKTWITDAPLYSDLKFISDETFKTSPKILEEAMKRMCVVNELEGLQFSEAAERELPNINCHRSEHTR